MEYNLQNTAEHAATGKESAIAAPGSYAGLVERIGEEWECGRANAIRAVNAELLTANWNIGRHIVEFEQGGKAKAEYGKELLKHLAADLTARYGKGFSRSKLIYMRLFYLMFPKGATASHLLSWSHYLEILKVEDSLARDFYVNECGRAGWGVRELRRQIESSLFERYALSRDKAGVLALANKGAEPARPEDVVREPFVFEFTGINPVRRYTEKSLESRLCARLEDFMLELGKGYSFVGRQYAMQIGASRFKVDLVFYNRFLRCFVLIDLKRKGVTHRDIGQMNLYLNYFQNEEAAPGDNSPIGILLGSVKDNVVVEYAMQGITNKLFVARYQLYMPDREQLRRELAYILKSETTP